MSALYTTEAIVLTTRVFVKLTTKQSQFIRSLNFKPHRKKWQRLTQQDRNTIIALRLQKISYRQIAELMNTCIPTIRGVCYEAEIILDIPATHTYSQSIRDEAIRRYVEGSSVYEVRDQMGLPNHGTIWWWVFHAGVNRRTISEAMKIAWKKRLKRLKGGGNFEV